MARTSGHGNPNWTRDETLLALELYQKLDGKIPSGKSADVQALSNRLRAMPYHEEAAREASFRNPDGVAFKLQNIRQVATGKGLGNVSQTDRAIWAEFGERPAEVSRLAEAIRVGMAEVTGQEITPIDDEFSEGRILTALHYRRERDPRLRSKLLKARADRIVCETCDSSWSHLPTDLRQAAFEAHHLRPLTDGERVTKLSDVALLCACCHRQLHRVIVVRKRWVGVAEARGVFGAERS